MTDASACLAPAACPERCTARPVQCECCYSMPDLARRLTSDAGRLGSKVRSRTFPGASHLGLLRQDDFVEHVVSLLTQSTWEQRLQRSLGFKGTTF